MKGICKTPSCPNPKYGTSSVCREHFLERAAKKLSEKKMKPKKRKPPKKTTVRNRLDSLFSRLIRSVGRCEKCGATEATAQLHCSHIISRSYLSTRWLELNAKCLCATHHRWWHEKPTEAVKWLTESGLRSEADVQELQRLSNTTRKWTVEEYLELEQELKEKLENLTV